MIRIGNEKLEIDCKKSLRFLRYQLKTLLKFLENRKFYEEDWKEMLKFVDHRRKKHLRNDLFCRIFFNFWWLNSSVFGLFIDCLTSGLGFNKYC